MKLAFIVQRYGREILGGSETLARQLAERLARRHEVTVLTTTARDYITWRNEYEPGEQKLRGVRILRFPVSSERNLEEFNKYSEEIYHGKPTREQELEWLDRQGPVVPELVEHLKKEQNRYDLLVFFTYLYYPTYYGLQVAPEKSILVPTAHDEPPLRLGIFREMFQLPSSFLFNTESEEVLMLERFPIHKKMRETIGMGMELLDQPDTSAFRKKHGIPGRYLLYAGRIDPGKGLEELFRYFTFYKEENPASGNLQLILIGKLGMKLPDDSAIRYIGFVDEGDKLSAMAGSEAVVQPSRLESLSIVTLEAFSVGTPVVVNGASRVLLDHCRKANAGFYYNDFEEFEAILNLLASDRALARAMGRNGQRYVKENYGWHKLLPRYELALRASARPAKEPRTARREAPQPSREPAERPERRVTEAVVPDEEALLEPTGGPPAEKEDEVQDRAQEAQEIQESAEVTEEEIQDSLEEEGESHHSAEEEEEEVRDPAEEKEEVQDSAEEDEEVPHPAEEEEESPLPSFYRASIPPRAPESRPVPPDASPPDPRVDPKEPDRGERPERAAKEPPEETEPGELPEFYKPRSPRGAEEEKGSNG
ncbi:MAG TPA: glycosyltransferase [Vicinamibacteria bacterium]|nr:glycosyltransferase [Vicinamibacteria bacterium]